MNQYIADYLRLSLDDEGIGESNSISSQRQIIQDYISSVPEFVGMPVKEFVDDGYSGTNFNRPGIKRLLDAVRRGEVSCIIVKDLSRFGRKYLEVSKYIEQLFPYIGVRFIAVNDHYDSNNHKGTTAEMDVAVRNMINAMYSKDVSKKAKSAKRTQAGQGKFIHAFAPYGYMKDKADIHHIVIDEPAAVVVKRIFELACQGQGNTAIANILNADGVPTPADYKKQNGSKHKSNGITKSLWSAGSIIRILRDEQYTGTFIAGKVETGELGSGKVIRKSKDEWIKIPGAIPAIITQEAWDTVLAKRGKQGGIYKKPNTGRILYKKVRCGYCGHVMRYRNEAKASYYFCETPRHTDEYGCLCDRYSEQMIVDVVKVTVKTQLAVMLNMEKLCRDNKKDIRQHTESAQSAAARLETEIGHLQAFKRQLYERFKSGSLEKTEYLNERETVESKIIAKTVERDRLITQSDNQGEAISTAEQFFGSFKQYETITEPTTEMVTALVETINVFGKDRIEIQFAYRDELKQAILFLEQSQ
ncbi:MAG: recombinase family protein [Oscillospiraceae bacterium]|nr:recombinase family protein [Oscillospiraceae bacterium]